MQTKSKQEIDGMMYKRLNRNFSKQQLERYSLKEMIDIVISHGIPYEWIYKYFNEPFP